MARSRVVTVLIGPAALLLVASTAAFGQEPAGSRTGAQVYGTICITCHGPDGRAGVNLELEKIIKPPDFTSCAFASREPDRGFLAVAHGGGPARGFSPMMPAWGSAFTEAELARAIEHIRTFCKDDRWPRGELNLPLALVTGKAFPEDEALVRVTSQTGNLTTKAVYERRFGPLNQWEVGVPFSSIDDAGRSSTGVGDVTLGYKRTLTHGFRRGNILSASAEMSLPTGSEAKGHGSGVAAVEPFLTFAQLLPGRAWVQAQGGFGVPMSADRDKEVFWRVAVGRSVEQGAFGRLWSPMLEVLAARPLVSGSAVEWDLLPGVQVTLNRRQHIRAAAGVRFPVTQTDHRQKSLATYLLWDWYEGGFHKGW